MGASGLRVRSRTLRPKARGVEMVRLYLLFFHLFDSFILIWNPFVTGNDISTLTRSRNFKYVVPYGTPRAFGRRVRPTDPEGRRRGSSHSILAWSSQGYIMVTFWTRPWPFGPEDPVLRIQRPRVGTQNCRVEGQPRPGGGIKGIRGV